MNDKSDTSIKSSATPSRENVFSRRKFIKVSAGATLCVLTFLSARTLTRQSQCPSCGVALHPSEKLVSQRGKCRNCGADVATGLKIRAEKRLTSLPQKDGPKFSEACVPFPHPDLRDATTKPCASLRDLRSGQSRIRQPFTLG